MTIERWDVYDKNRIKTGRTVERGQRLGEDEYYMAIHVCIFNAKNEMLIQQRQPWKPIWPDMWDITVGGAAQAGETSAQTACRETLEEIGYKIDLSITRPVFTVNFARGFDDYYVLKRDLAIESLTLQFEEVQAVKWAGRDEISQLMQDQKLINYWFIDHLFEIQRDMAVSDE